MFEVGDGVRVMKSHRYVCEAGPGAEGEVVAVRDEAHSFSDSPIDVKLTKYNPDWAPLRGQTPQSFDVYNYEAGELELITEET